MHARTTRDARGRREVRPLSFVIMPHGTAGASSSFPRFRNDFHILIFSATVGGNTRLTGPPRAFSPVLRFRAFREPAVLSATQLVRRSLHLHAARRSRWRARHAIG